MVWRGPIIANTVKQFWTEVIWSDVDYMFVDMPPGTGDVPLTVFQSIPLDGIIIVTSPQELVAMIVSKAVNMAQMMNVPIVGIVENMSYVKCPDCGRKIRVFGESHVEEVAAKYGLKLLGRLPMDPEMAKTATSVWWSSAIRRPAHGCRCGRGARSQAEINGNPEFSARRFPYRDPRLFCLLLTYDESQPAPKAGEGFRWKWCRTVPRPPRP